MNDLHTAYEALRKEGWARYNEARRSGRIKAERLDAEARCFWEAAALVIGIEVIKENEDAD